MKKDNTKKSRKINAEKKAARKPRLTKEEREARKLKLQEERAAKKLKAKVRAEKKAAREAKKADKKPRAKKIIDAKKVSIQEKIEAERNEWKALSAIRRYVKDNAKILEELDGDKLARKIKKLQKMGYTIDVENGTPISIGYDFEIGVRIKVAKPASEKKERKPRKPRTEKVEEEEVQQPQDSTEILEPEQLPAEAEEKLLSDDEILEAAKQDTEPQPVEILAGDTFRDETEIADDDGLKNLDDDNDDDDEDDDILGSDGDISDEQADYRREAFREMEGNGAWD